MFDNFNVNLRKNKGFLTYIPYIPIPEYGQLNAPLVVKLRKLLLEFSLVCLLLLFFSSWSTLSFLPFFFLFICGKCITVLNFSKTVLGQLSNDIAVIASQP